LAEPVFSPAAGPIYEFACREGDYGLPNILSAGRAKDAAVAGNGK